MAGRNFFRKYRAAILFNKNLLISGAAGLLASAYTSQLFSQFDRNELANSAVALATEYAVYLPLFSILFYLDNHQKYRDPETGRKDYGRVRSDVKKLFASFSVSEIVYSIVRIGSQYGLLMLDVEAYEASILSSLTAWGVFFASINLMASLTKLHEK